MQADDPLVVVAGAQHEDRRGVPGGDRDLVAGQQRDAAPGGHDAAVHHGGLGVEPAARALPPEGGYRFRMGQEEPGLAAAGEQFVEVVGGGRPAASVDPLSQVGVVQQADVRVVDELVLLSLAQRLDREAELLVDLVHRLVEQVGDPGVHLEHGLGDVQFVLAGPGVVVGERPGQVGLALVPGSDLDGRLAPAVHWRNPGNRHLGQQVQRKLQGGARRHRGRRGSAGDAAALGDDAHGGFMTVLALADPGGLAVHDQDENLAVADDLPGGVLPLAEPGGQLGQHVLAGLGQGTDLPQRGRDHPGPSPLGGEPRDP